MPAVTIPDSDSALLRASRSGREYRIEIAFPEGPPPATGFPALFLIDGHKFFGTLVESVRARCHRPAATGVSPAVIVGVSPNPPDTVSRTLDYTPGPSKEGIETTGGATRQAGGAEDFLAFIEDDLKPWIGNRIAIDPVRRALFGHSLGGYFVLHTLVTRPDRFQSYVAISPSIWWDRALLFDADLRSLRDAAAGPGGLRAMISVGEYEQPTASPDRQAGETRDRHRRRRMVDNARDFAERLVALKAAGLDVRFHEFAGEDHASNVTITIGKSLRLVLAP